MQLLVNVHLPTSQNSKKSINIGNLQYIYAENLLSVKNIYLIL